MELVYEETFLFAVYSALAIRIHLFSNKKSRFLIDKILCVLIMLFTSNYIIELNIESVPSCLLSQHDTIWSAHILILTMHGCSIKTSLITIHS